MNDALILSAPRSFSNPRPDTQYVPDIDTGLLWELNANSLAQADNTDVLNWIAGGVDTALSRTFNAVVGAAHLWAPPKFSLTGGPDGGPTVKFDGTQRIANGTGTSNIPQPVLWAAVVKCTDFTGPQQRIFSTSGHYLSAYNFVAAAGGAAINSGYLSNEWTVVVGLADGEKSKLKVGNQPILSGSVSTQGSQQSFIGGQGNSLATKGFVGSISHIRKYNRPVTRDSDIIALQILLAQKYGITI